jgi:ABC-type sugar transport system ATPase subunit
MAEDSDYLEVDGISKGFPGVQALQGVSFTVQRGEIHAVAGENGAGKSTLMKVLAGLYAHETYEGKFLLEGKEGRFRSSLDAEAVGIVMIPQELAVVNELSVAENMFLNAWPIRFGRVEWPTLYRNAKAMIRALKLDVDPETPIKKLSAAEKQLVLIGKAISKNVRLLILDEPTSSLSESEREILFVRLKELKAKGVTALYISHKLEEIMAISDAVTVLRDGKLVETRRTANLTPQEIVRLMVGRPITQMYPREERSPGQIALEVEELTLYHPDLKTTKVIDNASFSLRSGEIVGLYGLMGSGRTELMAALYGAWPGAWTAKKFQISEKPLKPAEPKHAMSHGLGMLTEDRKQSGIIPGKDLTVNITVTCLEKVSRAQILNRTQERVLSEKLVRDLKIRAASVAVNIETLSGGNQQKVLIGRLLAADARILLLDEPTRGIDVGAKVEIFRLLNGLAAAGAAVLFVSSELPEVLGVADRILVIHEGKIQTSIPWQEATEERVMHHATGQERPGTTEERSP